MQDTQNRARQDLKCCVVVENFHVFSQTFVNRHIAHLFSGNTCVITDHLFRDQLVPTEVNKPTHVRLLSDLPIIDKLCAPFVISAMRLCEGTRHGSWGAARRRVLEFLAREKPDVILSEFGPQTVAIAPIAQAAGIPIFGYFRGSDASSRIQHKHVQKAYRKMMPRLAGIISVSQFLLDNLASVGVTHPNAHVIPSGVDVTRFVPSGKRPNSCLALGRFVEKKQPLVTIRAFAEALKSTPSATLTMVGDGELFEPAKALVAELGLQDAVSLPGARPHEDVRDLLSQTELFLQHSVTANNGNTEGLPTAIQEAMAAGCVTVSTRHAGIPEAIDEGITGFLSDEFDVEGYTRDVAMALALSEKDKQAIGQKAREVAKDRFDNAKLLVRLEQVLVRAI